MNINKIIFTLNKSKHKKHLIHILVILFVLILTLILNSKKEQGSKFISKKKLKDKIMRIDTMIPKGFVLIPIEVSNLSTLSEVLSQTATGDLYYRNSNKSVLVAKFLQILRSPRNPNKISVLAPENIASEIFKYKGPFHVALKNPKFKNDSKKAKSVKKYKSRIREAI